MQTLWFYFTKWKQNKNIIHGMNKRLCYLSIKEKAVVGKKMYWKLDWARHPVLFECKINLALSHQQFSEWSPIRSIPRQAVGRLNRKIVLPRWQCRKTLIASCAIPHSGKHINRVNRFHLIWFAVILAEFWSALLASPPGTKVTKQPLNGAELDCFEIVWWELFCALVWGSCVGIDLSL